MFRTSVNLSNILLKRQLCPFQISTASNILRIEYFSSGDDDHREREPRRYARNPVTLHRRIELPNPEFTDRKPKNLESSNYFDQRDVDEETSTTTNESAEKDQLYTNIEIETRSHDTAVLKSFETFALSAAKNLDLKISSIYVPREPYTRWLRTLLRSVHIFKKRRFQYEVRTYYRRFTLARLTGSTAETYLEYIQRNLPEGVGMRVMKRLLIERPNFLKQPPKAALEKEQSKVSLD